MAILKLSNGKDKTISLEQSHEIWSILNGEKEPTKEQEEYCSNIDKIYLNWRKAPDSYIRDRFDIIAGMHMAEWAVDNQGTTVRPENYISPDGKYRVWVFARKWGFLDENGKTKLAKKHAGEI